TPLGLLGLVLIWSSTLAVFFGGGIRNQTPAAAPAATSRPSAEARNQRRRSARSRPEALGAGGRARGRAPRGARRGRAGTTPRRGDGGTGPLGCESAEDISSSPTWLRRVQGGPARGLATGYGRAPPVQSGA